MSKDIVMPKMGYDMTEGKLVRWVKREGESVAKGEVIAEIETDKVTIEVEAFDAGVLRRLLVQEGSTVPVGEPIATLAAPGEEDGQGAAVQAAQGAAGGGVTPPATVQASSPAAAATGETPPPTPPAHEPTARGASRPASAGRGADEGVKASPLARQLAREHGLDLAAIQGSGPDGRITREDVLAAVAAGGAAPSPSAAPLDPSAAEHGQSTAAPAAPMTTGTRTQPLTRLQQTMGRRMAESKTQAPHFYLTVQADMTEAMALRKQLNAAADEDKVSVNDIIVAAAARALVSFPTLNASFAGETLTLHEDISICVAVAIEDGLVTPVVRHADTKTLAQIARETRGLAERARQGKSRAEDYEGGTFTVSNLGMFDIDTFVAIINPPQAAILAVGAVRRVPVYLGDALAPRERMSMTLSADHRVTDGATGARFLAALRGYLEQPQRLVEQG